MEYNHAVDFHGKWKNNLSDDPVTLPLAHPYLQKDSSNSGNDTTPTPLPPSGIKTVSQ